MKQAIFFAGCAVLLIACEPPRGTYTPNITKLNVDGQLYTTGLDHHRSEAVKIDGKWEPCGNSCEATVRAINADKATANSAGTLEHVDSEEMHGEGGGGH